MIHRLPSCPVCGNAIPRAARHCLNCHCPAGERGTALPPVILSLGDYREVRTMMRRAPASAARALLERELARAIVALPSQELADIATLNSRVAYRYSAIDGSQVRTLVGPGGVDTSGGTLSVLAPIGAALLGLRAGSTMEWMEDGVPRSVTLERIMFPGSAGRTFDGGSVRA